MKYLPVAIFCATLLLVGILLYATSEYTRYDRGYSTFYRLRICDTDVSLECWRTGLWTFRLNHDELFHLEPSNNLEPIELTD